MAPLETVEFFDLDVAAQYAVLLENATTAAKVGPREQRRKQLMVEARHLDRLRALAARAALSRARRRRGSLLVSTWNLVVPVKVLERSWAEVT